MLWIKRFAWLGLCLCLTAGLAAAESSGQWPVASGQKAEECRELQTGHRPLTTDHSVLLDFYSDWCGPCQSMRPAIDALVNDGYAVQRVNIDDRPDMARQYGVTAIPCFVVLQRGREVDRVNGVVSLDRLKVHLTRVSRETDVGGTGLASGTPHPAWRYEQPVGYRAAVVRIFCEDAARVQAIGSGTLVKWNGRLVVLTARHVVKDAQRIIVELCTKRAHRAKVIRMDAVWDCAVLELVGQPEGVEPAELELGSGAVQREGNRLESCGYGPDGRLACNSGLFLGYKRSAETPQGPDDWMVFSGHARSGDSGGPVFNERGRLVGVLWGTDGQEVVGVQAGRLHKLLDAAVPEPKPLVVQERAIRERNPTPPREPACASGVCCPAAYGKPQPVLTWRDGAQRKDTELDARIEAIIAIEERQARAAATITPVKPEPPAKDAATIASKNNDASSGVAVAVILGGLAVGGAFCALTKRKPS
jgi:thiol-disulfide isomerase/thioredoxin